MQKSVKRSVPGIDPKTVGRGGRRVPSAEPSLIVLTIGHSTHTIEEFIRLLKAHGASCLVDVRMIPRSRHNPQLNKASLPRSLKRVGLGYVHSPGLGGLRRAKSASRRILSLYSAENRRRVAFASTSTSFASAPGTATPFEELMPPSLHALYSKLLGGECLIHIGTE
jgi:hypothetical protein